MTLTSCYCTAGNSIVLINYPAAYWIAPIIKGRTPTKHKQHQPSHLMISIRPTCCATLLLLVVLHDHYVISCSPTFKRSSHTTIPGQTRGGFDRDLRFQTPHPLNYRLSPGLPHIQLKHLRSFKGVNQFL